jgi:hypothetical protein
MPSLRFLPPNLRAVPALLCLPLLCVSLLCLPVLQGCSVLRMMTGTDFDGAQLAAAREAAVAEVRGQGAKMLATRLTSGIRADDADIVLSLGPKFIQKAAVQLVGSHGWIDENTSYRINSVIIELQHGSAIASLQLRAHSDSWAVDVDLVMDCIMSLQTVKNELTCVLEPFHISPSVTTGVLLSQMQDIIRDLVTMRVASMGRDLPPVTFPLNIRSQYALEQSAVAIRGPVNLDLFSPKRSIDYTLRIKDVLMLREAVIVGIDITGTEAR